MSRSVLCSLLLFVAASVCGMAQERGHHSLVALGGSAAQIARVVADLGVEHAMADRDGVELVVPADSIRSIRATGLRVRVLVEDVEDYYVARASGWRSLIAARPVVGSVPANFSLGSVLGEYTIDELEAALSAMHQRFPQLASAPVSIGTSVEGRDIRAVRISAVATDDTTAAEALYTGMIHAREPAAMTTLVYTMWSLLDDYGVDPDATWLLEHRVLWFVPLVNPDGYAYNLKLWPDGGGLWRRNMRANGDSGVDLNRNFGPPDSWNALSGGSSDAPGSSQYRGTGPFSEPESRAIRDFCLVHRFSVAFDQHTFGNVIIEPFDDVAPTSAAQYSRVLVHAAAATCGYAAGGPLVCVGYEARGTAEEWMFRGDGQSESDTIIAIAPEIGTDYDGFWPYPDRIVPLAQQMLPAHRFVAEVAGSWPRVESVSSVESGHGTMLHVVVRNIGRMPLAAGASVTARALGGTITLPALAPQQSNEVDIPVPDTLLRFGPVRLDVDLTLAFDGLENHYHAAPIIRSTTPLFSDDCDDASKWVCDTWGIESVDGHGGVLSDSPGGPYQPTSSSAEFNAAETAVPISLRSFDAVDLQFDARFEVMAHGQEGEVEVRRAGESEWHPVQCDRLQVQYADPDSVRNRMRGDGDGWQRYTARLDDYAGSDIYLRFSMRAVHLGTPEIFDGIKIDNLRVFGASASQAHVEDPTDDGGIRLIAGPNPFTSRLSVRLQDATARAEFSLVDLLGRTVKRSSGTAVSFDTEDLPDGYYTVVVDYRGNRFVRPVVLRR